MLSQRNVIIAGLGAIGSQYDINKTNDYILTHSRAVNLDSGFQLVAGIDPKPESRKTFKEQYGVQAYSQLGEIEDALVENSIFVVAVPTDQQMQTVQSAIERKASLVVCEKPAGANYEECKKLAGVASQTKTSIVVNYFRRFLPDIINLKSKIQLNELGRPIAVNAWYSGSLVNNGSHMIDLVNYFLGIKFSVKSKLDKAVFLNSECGVSFSLQEWDADLYSNNSIHIYFEKGQLELGNGGQSIGLRMAGQDLIYEDFQSLSSGEIQSSTDMRQAQKFLYSHLDKYLKGECQLASSAVTALETSALVDAIINYKGAFHE